ncbi:uncharacterized protein LOC112050690 [Bicyclus anynana]|uniref:Uncharacterized protein LOC112050690 n=1 Tax=Bicyclus anynana TaxID=110368 RepID=A0A6J1NIG7_BICAN|nr:uncharacterized protein LOC112050690 [Bicyclus anynana]
MAARIANTKHLAILADKGEPCAFCKRNFDDESIYGKLYSIGDIHCHYFCALLSCCLIQKGQDYEGLFGFMYPDIMAEVKRSKKHKCSYCGQEGATLGCSVAKCKKQFHLPCGRERHAVSLYYGNYKSFCEKHAPKQIISPAIMDIVKARLSKMKKKNKGKCLQKKKVGESTTDTENAEEEPVCVICYEAVEAFPSAKTFWPPCCARDAWFHRPCLQRMALSAGVHYLKCPLCNDKVTFTAVVHSQGYYIPDRDAAWELEQNAFSGMYERRVECLAEVCKCPNGRNYDANSGIWDVKLCVLCGSPGVHAGCTTAEHHVCAVCTPAAPDPPRLAVIDSVSLPRHSQDTQQTRSGGFMPCRMSIRRTKPRHVLLADLTRLPRPSCSSQNNGVSTRDDDNNGNQSANTTRSREELNLRTPKRPNPNHTDPVQPADPVPKQPENDLLSPLKLLKQGLIEKISVTEADKIIFEPSLMEQIRKKFSKPRPLCVKRKMISDIISEILNYAENEPNIVMDMKNSTDIGNDEGPIEDVTNEHKNISDTNMKTPCPEEIPIQNQKDTETLGNTTKYISENANLTPKKPESLEDESSSSPFQLPPEFIADSSNSLPITDTPKKLKKVNIQNDSMEISENNQIVNIDLVENGAPEDHKLSETKCLFKLNPLNKDMLHKNVDIDLESFKNQYLNEVDRKINIKFERTHESTNERSPLKGSTAVDLNNTRKPPKRKLPSRHDVANKKRKTTKTVRKLKNKYKLRTNDRESDTAGQSNNKENTIKRRSKKRYSVRKDDKDEGGVKKERLSHKDGVKKRKYKRKHTKLSINNRNIKLKIRFQSSELNLKITKSKRSRRVKKESPKVLKQYILQYPADHKPLKDYIVRPDTDVIPILKKKIKSEMLTDNLKQTSIINFFKVSPKN